MSNQPNDIGMIGLGVMGRNLVLNMADHGFSVAGYDRDAEQVKLMLDDAAGQRISATNSIHEFLSTLRQPRSVMMLVPAGKPVDAVIEDLHPLLQPGDLIIDAGNSHFRDTDRRAKDLSSKGLHFMGVGVSGWEHGARFGPSIMPGGPADAYDRVRTLFEAIAAKVGDEPCVAYLGPGSAGHFVKMVHNGIEYGIMELIAEAYDIMKRGLGMNDDALHDVFATWNAGELDAFLMEITAEILVKEDDRTPGRLVDFIKDAARQKGTGRWTAQDAMDLTVPIPTIDTAVSMREMSSLKQERLLASKHFGEGAQRIREDLRTFLKRLRNAVWFAVATTYAQGMALLRSASAEYHYHVPLAEVAALWRGGCIIRSGMLENIRNAYRKRPSLQNLMLDPFFSDNLAAREGDLRSVVQSAVTAALPIPAFMASLSYFDAYRSAWLPANLLQAQRDFFGAHTYERIDEKGTFHTQWTED